MPLPAVLIAQVNRLRASFRAVTLLTGPRFLDEIRDNVDALADKVVRSPALQEAYEGVLEQAVAIFAASNTPDALTTPQALEALKATADTRLDALEAALTGSRPTPAAMALGYDW